MNAWTCEKCGQKFPAKYRERHLQAHDRIKTFMREYETSNSRYKRKDDRGEAKTK